MKKEFNLREKLAELEHEQWMSWSKYVRANNLIPFELLAKWEKNWKPYSELDEKTKDADRIWADKNLVLFEEWKKEFIKKLKEEFDTEELYQGFFIRRIIDKLAGEKLNER